ncbi:MAG: hypothetical protein ACOZNI_36075, partial [Myxococcota bacterium]
SGPLMLTRRHFIVGTAALLACARKGPVDRGRDFLIAQQAADGSFPSRTYGVMSGGDSLTPFAGLALAGTEAAARAAAWCALHLDADGALGLASGDYPVYATAMAARLMGAVGGHADAVARACAWLEAQQLRDGWEGHPAHGGWPMGSRSRPTPPESGHVDLSMTRRAIEALAAAKRSGPATEAARGFVRRCAAATGGYVYSPVHLALNKGPCTAEGCAGYGSATCDGILALTALGEDVARDVAWLRGVHRLDENPGVRGGALDAFATAMKGYYRAGSAQVFARHGGPDGWREALRAAALADQRPDGSWRNEDALQREDDPIIATGFALVALSA